jgi:hypothetical protein
MRRGSPDSCNPIASAGNQEFPDSDKNVIDGSVDIEDSGVVADSMSPALAQMYETSAEFSSAEHGTLTSAPL